MGSLLPCFTRAVDGDGGTAAAAAAVVVVPVVLATGFGDRGGSGGFEEGDNGLLALALRGVGMLLLLSLLGVLLLPEGERSPP